MSNETIVDSNEPTAPQRTLKFNNLTPPQKSRLSAAAAGIGGISLGALAMVLMSSSLPTEEVSGGAPDAAAMGDTASRQTGEEEIEVPIYSEAPFAEATNDNMSFDQAFASARAEVGAGGFFEWHGNSYNTYYKEEWDALSPEDRKAFFESIDSDDKGTVTNEEVVIDEEEILAILNEDETNEDGIIIEENNDIFKEAEEDIVINDNDDYDDVVAIDDNDGEIVIIDDNNGGSNDMVVIEDDNYGDEDITVIEDDFDITDLG